MADEHVIVLIQGDGIGPEVTAAVLRVLEAAGAPLRYEEHVAGIAALEAGLPVLPEQTLDAIRRHHVALKGPCTTPVGDGFTSVNVQLRQKLNLYAAVRPVRSLNGVPTPFENVDLVIFRENTEGLYSGVENEIVPGVVTSLKIASETACTRISRRALAYVKDRGRRSLTVFHKANIMKLSDGLFLRCVRRVHEEHFPDVTLQERIIDAGCMKLVQDPTQFDVLLMENLYGDVVSDLAAGLVGGLGVVPGANIGDEDAVFEAVHGSAPDIAGKGVANPLALLMSAVMMLNHLHESRRDEAARAAATRIKTAYDRALADGAVTRDLGGELSTDGFAGAVIEQDPVLTVRTWTVPGSGGQPIFGNTHEPPAGDRPAAALVICHGFKGYKDYGFFPHLAAAAARANLVAHRFNFSHSGMTGNIETFERPSLFEQDTWARQVEDAITVVEQVAEPAALPVVLFGHSRGGITAILAAEKLGRRLAGVIPVASPHEACSLDDDQREMLRRQGRLPSPSSRTGQTLYVGRAWLDQIEQDPAGTDPVRAIARLEAPVLLIHGADDPTVPIESMHRLHEAARNAQALAVPAAGHTFNCPNPLAPDAEPPPETTQMIEAAVAFALRCAGEGG